MAMSLKMLAAPICMVLYNSHISKLDDIYLQVFFGVCSALGLLVYSYITFCIDALPDNDRVVKVVNKIPFMG
jgi:hypothetical protein